MNANVFLATTGKGLARAVADESGEYAVEHLLGDKDVRCLAADPQNRDIVFAGTQGQGVLRSDDRGQSWRPAGLDGIIVKSLAVSPTVPGTIFAGTKSPASIYVSRDGGGIGRSWKDSDIFADGASGSRLRNRLIQPTCRPSPLHLPTRIASWPA